MFDPDKDLVKQNMTVKLFMSNYYYYVRSLCKPEYNAGILYLHKALSWNKLD